MRAKIQLLLLDGLLHGNTIHNILLGPVLDSDKAESQLHVLAFEHPLGIGTFVHNIDFCDDTDRPNTLWIKFPRHLQTI